MGSHCGVNPTPDKKIAQDLQAPGFEGRHQVIQNLVGHRFVEVALVAKGPEVELKRFKLYTEFVGDVSDVQLSEVRLARLGADTGKLGALKLDLVVPVHFGIGKGL